MTDTTRRVTVRIAFVALFLVGVILSTRRSPEWIVDHTPSPSEIEAKAEDAAQAAGYEVNASARKSELRFGSSRSDISIRGEVSDLYGLDARRWLVERGLGLLASVDMAATHPPTGMQGVLSVSSDMQGNIVALEFQTSNLGDFIKPAAATVEPDEYRVVARMLLRPGEDIGEGVPLQIGAQRFVGYPVVGSIPPETITATEPPGIRLVNRRPGSPEDIQRFYDRVLTLSNFASRGVGALLRFGLILFFGVLFIVLAVKRNIGLRTGVMLGALALVLSLASMSNEVAPGAIFWLRLVFSLLAAVWCVVVWSGSESWLRTVNPGMLQTIDTIASFRPGPKSGRAIVDGWFAGLGLAGFLLLLESGFGAFFILSTPSSLHLSVFGVQSPLSRAVLLSGGVIAAAAAAQYFRGRTEKILAIALTTVAILPAIGFSRWLLTFSASLIAAALFRRMLVVGGAAAVLATSLNFLSAPSAAFALRHLDWMPYTAAAASFLVLAPLVFATAGLRKPAENETLQIVTPRFMRRLEEERRVRFEMGLLAEMQLRMLPESAPAIEGWDIAATSVLASEVGGDLYDYLEDEDGNLWIAIGDVSGHGYQCAIAQAMTKASLSTLVTASLSPAAVLERIDKALRRGGSRRTFTSLALAKVDPKTGHVVLSNAGNPFPVHVTVDGRVHEVEIPSLPLGMGPPRSYVDVDLQLGPRDYLLFYSDGLVEVRNRNEEMLGFEKPAALVRMRRGQTAEEIVAGLEKAWNDHLDGEEIQDDTTIVVVRRT